MNLINRKCKLMTSPLHCLSFQGKNSCLFNSVFLKNETSLTLIVGKVLIYTHSGFLVSELVAGSG